MKEMNMIDRLQSILMVALLPLLLVFAISTVTTGCELGDGTDGTSDLADDDDDDNDDADDDDDDNDTADDDDDDDLPAGMTSQYNDCINGANADSDPMREEACRLLDYVNADRAYWDVESDDAQPLEWDEDIWEVAIAHSQDMCDNSFFEHENESGQTPWDRMVAAGLDFAGFSENIALNLDVAAAEHAFMAEPTCTGHRGNILEPSAITIGIGVVLCDYFPGFGDDYQLVTQNFRIDPTMSSSPYCDDAATACEVPDNPVSEATADCPADLASYGFCDDVDDSLLGQWGCPDD
jgi:uncharacterized protein YkwD